MDQSPDEVNLCRDAQLLLLLSSGFKTPEHVLVVIDCDPAVMLTPVRSICGFTQQSLSASHLLATVATPTVWIAVACRSVQPWAVTK